MVLVAGKVGAGHRTVLWEVVIHQLSGGRMGRKPPSLLPGYFLPFLLGLTRYSDDRIGFPRGLIFGIVSSIGNIRLERNASSPRLTSRFCTNNWLMVL